MIAHVIREVSPGTPAALLGFMTKQTKKTSRRALQTNQLAAVTGGMNKADLTEQLAFCDDMTIALKTR